MRGDREVGRVQEDQALAVPAEPASGLNPSGFDPSRVEILSLGYSKAACTKERWNEIFASYSPRARYHASNLAAHNWDVLLIGGRVFLCAFFGERGHWLAPDFGLGHTTFEDATDEEMAALYSDPKANPKKRLFCDSDGSAERRDLQGLDPKDDSAGLQASPDPLITPPKGKGGGE